MRALEILAQHPDAEPVGVILDGQAADADAFRRLLGQQLDGPVAGYVGVLPRAMADMTATQAVDFLAWCFSSDEPRLPIVAVIQNGYRFAGVPLVAGA